MAQDNYALLTRKGRLKEAQRIAGQAVPAITHMAFGDFDRSPTGGETALGHEVLRLALTNWGVYADQTGAYFDCYLPAEVGGFVIREVGLFDAAGDLIAIGRRSPALPKTAPEDGGGDDFTVRMDVFFDDLDTLVVEVSPIAGLTAENLPLFLFPANIPIEGIVTAPPGAPVDLRQWIIGPGATGIFAGKDHQIARYRAGWTYQTPRAGRVATAWTGGRLVHYRFDGAAWGEWAASEATPGPVEMADVNETRAGTATDRAVHPGGLADRLALIVANAPVIDQRSSPPGSPVAGDQHLIAPNPTGIWAGKAGQIGRWIGGMWRYELPRAGLVLTTWTGLRLSTLRYDGAAWAEWVASEAAAGPVAIAGVNRTRAGTSTDTAVSPADLADRLGLVAFNLPVSDYANTPPAVPTGGLAYVIGTAPTGDWVGQAGKITRFIGGQWVQEAPRVGHVATYRSGARLVTIAYDGAAWAEWLATDSAAGPVELATPAETQAGLDNTRAVTPFSLASLSATLTRAGLVELATDVETQTGTDPSRAVTPAGLSARTATETRTGLVEIATQAEVLAFADPLRPIVPAYLRAAIDARIDAKAASSLLWPHVARLDARFDIASPAAFAVELQQTVSFFWRGLVPFALSDYPVAMANANALKWTGLGAGTYHLVWYPPGSANAGAEAPVATYPQGRWIMRPISDANYNPGAVAETDTLLDGNHDKVLAARVIIAGDGTATIKRYYVKGSYNLAGSFTVPVSEAGAGSGNYVGSASFALDWAVRPYYEIAASDVRGSYGASGAGFVRAHTTSATREGLNLSIGNYTRLSQNPVFDFLAVR